MRKLATVLIAVAVLGSALTTLTENLGNDKNSRLEYGYWSVKRKGEVIRWMIGLTGLEVVETIPASNEDWFGNMKPKFGEPFANLPYLVDGDFKLTESEAILNYLAEKANRLDLIGKTAQDRARVRQVQGVCNDIVMGLLRIGLTPGVNIRDALEKQFSPGAPIHTMILDLSRFLGNKDYFLGYVTIADMTAAYTGHFTASFARANGLTCPFCKHANLAAMNGRLVKLPGLKEVFEARKSVPFMPDDFFRFRMPTITEMERGA